MGKKEPHLLISPYYIPHKQSLQGDTSSLKAGMRDLGLKMISTLVVPPRGSRVIGPAGDTDNTSTDCSLGEEGVKARWKVMAAGELLTIGTYFLTISPT